MARIGDGRKPSICRKHGKLLFETENEAKLQLTRAQALRAQGGDWDKIECRYYRCETGKGYHLTSQPKRGGQR